jgi:hypothetical protein
MNDDWERRWRVLVMICFKYIMQFSGTESNDKHEEFQAA